MKMFKAGNINKISKMLMIMLSAMFLFTACSTDTADDDKRPPVTCDTGGTDPKPRPCTDEDYAKMEKQQIDCWQKAIVVNLYDIMGATTTNMYTKITDGALALMMVAFAVWFSFRILAHVSSFVEENPAEVWTEVTRKFFLCLVCGTIAGSPSLLLGVLNMTVFPVYGAFLEFGSEILARASDQNWDQTVDIKITGKDALIAAGGITGNVAGGITGYVVANATGADEIMLFNEPITWWKTKEPVLCHAGAMDDATLKGFPEMPKEMMSCLICAINQRMNLGFSLAFEIMGAPGITATLVGLMILLCFTIVKFGFVFYIVDTIFKFTVMIVILPIMVMGYAFQYTRSWLGKGILQILNSAAFMMFIAVIIAMAMMAIETLIMNNPKIFNPGDADMKTTFQEFSVPFMCLLMISFLIASSVGVAQQLSERLVGGSAKSEFAKKAQTVLMAVVNAALALFTWGGSLAVQKSASAAKIAMKAAKIKNKMNELSGRNE